MCDDGIYWICFDNHDNTFKVNHFADDDRIISTPYRFKTEKSCAKAIDKLGKEKLKLIFRIKE